MKKLSFINDFEILYVKERDNFFTNFIKGIVTYFYSELFLPIAIDNGFLNEKAIAKYICDQQPYCVH